MTADPDPPPPRRRELLEILGVTGGAATAVGRGTEGGERLTPYVASPDNTVPGVSTCVATTCRECSVRCGVRAEVRHGHGTERGVGGRGLQGRARRPRRRVARRAPRPRTPPPPRCDPLAVLGVIHAHREHYGITWPWLGFAPARLVVCGLGRLLPKRQAVARLSQLAAGPAGFSGRRGDAVPADTVVAPPRPAASSQCRRVAPWEGRAR